MQWKGRRESDNVDDRRGKGGLVLGGGAGIVLVILGLLFGQDLTGLVNQVSTDNQQVQQAPVNDEQTKFVKVVFASTEDVWEKEFEEMGKTYKRPILTLFTGATTSACGNASSAIGPFYCPADERVYIDLSFYDDLKNKFGAPGDFAQAYVIAHEVGHHVQNLLGTSAMVDRARRTLSEVEYNKLSVKLELQADFYAGLWAYHAKNDLKLDRNDLEEALTAANAIGDDRLQKQSQGEIVPDAFTHGTSAQRMYWFKKGFDTGDIRQGDTFNAKNL
ncbi:KPN_02809 family neutral zinc metallopeptidase [Pedobacter montanisoli]|uniref:Neutral zinc metallopeptidase n=1 Tax=Pedobacter montanisoli TaxID=2923277 RepID=A0ABS9ZTF9_9SPHI|nr:neutral zinc metallopeptidase [Pedobacter montanisoli]MCJ0741798.1 neutral zinc metallopeptidase [Pedobacter montanisoli]